MLRNFGVSVRLTGIDARALAAYREDWMRLPRPGWPNNQPPDWLVDQKALAGLLNRFEVAVWSGAEILCGLAVGRPSRGKGILRVDLLEGHPNPSHPLKGQVARSIVAAAFRYAEAIDAAELRLTRPLPAVVPLYRAMGFDLVESDDGDQYCALGIRP
jgi:hypothetical protein